MLVGTPKNHEISEPVQYCNENLYLELEVKIST